MKILFRLLNKPFFKVMCISTGILMCAIIPKSIAVRGEMTPLDNSIADSVLRFHIIANSDSVEDQKLKLKVKSIVASRISKDMSEQGISSKKQAQNYVKLNMDEYIDIAKQVISDADYNYDVSASLGKCWFPVKVYGDYIFPEGNYDAFRIIIGKGEGKNWWCVLFPSLCMVDESYQVTEMETSPAATPEAEPAQNPDNSSEEKRKFKFRIVEWFSDMW